MKTAADPTRHAAGRANAHHVADEHATGVAAFTAHRPEARAQQTLQALADGSPQAVAQRRLQETITNRMKAADHRVVQMNGGSKGQTLKREKERRIKDFKNTTRGRIFDPNNPHVPSGEMPPPKEPPTGYKTWHEYYRERGEI